MSSILTKRLSTSLFLIYAVLCIAKIVFVTSPAIGPTIFGDELLYRQYAYRLYNFELYRGKYPLLYPALMSLSFYFGSNFYEVMKLTNIIASSLLIFPVYLISRLFFDEKKSLALAAFSATIPFHFVFPRQIMSENLFFPLFFFGIYLSLRRAENRRIQWDVLTGLVFGAMYLTRNISLVLIVALLLSWVVTNRGKPLVTVSRALLVVVTAVATYAPWVAMQMFSGSSFSRALGFGIASRPNPDQLTASLLALWLSLYSCYFILLAGPNLPALFSALKSLATPKNWFENRLAVSVFLICLFIGAAVTRHSWRADYNYPEILRLMGRYLIYLPLLFTMVAAVVVSRETISKKQAAVLAASAIALVLFAYSTIYLDLLVDLDQSLFVTSRGALDGHIIRRFGLGWLVFAVMGICLLVAVWHFARGFAFSTVLIVALLANVAGTAVYSGEFKQYDNFVIPARAIANDNPRKAVVYADDRTTAYALKRSLSFWGVEAEVLNQMPAKIDGATLYRISSQSVDGTAIAAFGQTKVYRVKSGPTF